MFHAFEDCNNIDTNEINLKSKYCSKFLIIRVNYNRYCSQKFSLIQKFCNAARLGRKSHLLIERKSNRRNLNRKTLRCWSFVMLMIWWALFQWYDCVTNTTTHRKEPPEAPHQYNPSHVCPIRMIMITIITILGDDENCCYFLFWIARTRE